MKKIAKMLLAAFLIGGSFQPAIAQDHTLGLEMRLDWRFNNSDRDSDEDPNDDDKSSEFRFNRIRMNFKGKLNDMTSYRVRLRLDNSFDEGDRIDNTNPATEYAYLNLKLNSMLNLRLGKVFIYAGSREWDYSGMDQYHYSETSNQIPSVYETGAQVSVAVAGQTLALQVLNSPFRESNQQAYNFNLAWYGDLLNGMIEPIVTYGVFPHTDQEDADGVETDAYNVTQYGVGTRVNVGAIQLEAEIANVTTPEFDTDNTDGTTTESAEDTWDGIVLQARYKTKMFAPFIKYTQDDQDVDDEDATDHTGTSVGLEIFPNGTIKTYRLHAVYIVQTTEWDKDFLDRDDLTTTQINLGISTRFN